jgi:DNA-binding CsgD family transcriptional regulator
VLLGRHSECRTLDGLVEAARSGHSGALVVHGVPGVGKTALLEYLAGYAQDCRVLRAVGVQSEMELSFAGLHQLCVPVLDLLKRLPEPQREALSTAFGLSGGKAPDRFLVGLALLGLLAEAAAVRPLVCLVDDVQWMDHASTQALTIAARRLFAESVALVFATREHPRDSILAGLTVLPVAGLPTEDARTLLRAELPVPIDDRILDQIVAETEGNPLALVELPRNRTSAELAGGFGLPAARPLPDRIEENFRARITQLPEPVRRLLLLTAADPLGDPILLWRAAERLGVGVDAAGPATESGLVEFGARVRFRHPLARSAVYEAASRVQRQSAHRALAECTDPVTDPDRRAWHLARAATGPDEEVAAELERSASRAQARGGLPASAAFLARAVELTHDATQRGRRALAAAQAALDAGAPESAQALLSVAQAGHLDDLQHAKAGLLAAEVAFAVDRGADAPLLLLKAAQQLEPFDVRFARDTYLQALSATRFARTNAIEVAEAARASPAAPTRPSPADLLLDGLAARAMGELAFGTHLLKRSLRAFYDQTDGADHRTRWLWLAATTSPDLWDEQIWETLATRHVELARADGALSSLPLALTSRAAVHVVLGELPEAAAVVVQVAMLAEATGMHLAPYGAVMVAAWRGGDDEVAALAAATQDEVAGRGEGAGTEVYAWARSLLGNSLGQYADAVAATALIDKQSPIIGAGLWMLSERVEATARCGLPDQAAAAFRQLSAYTQVSGTAWALGIEARCRALVTEGETAERNYQESVELLGRTRVRGELARAHLLYGEWLRRNNHRLDAREQLRIANDMFTTMGMVAFAQRADRELLATGGTARSRTAEAGHGLTPQEAQVGWLVQGGLSNSEVAARLFLSPRTVEWHLSKVFGKLGIGSRRELRAFPRLPLSIPGGESSGHPGFDHWVGRRT